jgi:hypothetical protein
MKDALLPCTSCRCFIKAAEVGCPFCGVRVEPAPVLARVAGRTSRAKWVAFSSAMALVRCSSGSPTTEPTVDAGHAESSAPDARLADDTARVDSMADDDVPGDSVTIADASDVPGDSVTIADASDVPGDSVTIADTSDVATSDAASDQNRDVTDEDTSDPYDDAGPTFVCNSSPSSLCRRNEEYCLYPNDPLGMRHTQCIAYTAGDPYAPYPSQCMPVPTCACLKTVWQGLSTGGVSCYDDGLGAVSVSWSPCYGCPPARIERLV